MESARFFLFLLFTALTLGVLAIIVCVLAKLKPKEVRFETIISQAKVIRKNYEPDYTAYETQLIGSIPLPVKNYHFERFNVFLKYENYEFCIDDKELFAKVNFGDYVKIKVRKGYDKQDNLITNKIELFTE